MQIGVGREMRGEKTKQTLSERMVPADVSSAATRILWTAVHLLERADIGDRTFSADTLLRRRKALSGIRAKTADRIRRPP